ncbi:MAG: hypothetical protein BV456_00930 [Thermoplasmata archaeon M8B2D]|nr:MAG: hypothetical protein BV456_00930 [Thermoplasmata archaeon M8B2D]
MEKISNRKLLQTNFYAFYLYLFNFGKEKIITGWWEKEFCDNLQEAYYDYLEEKMPVYCFEAPVQHGKSTKLRYFLAWLIGRHRKKRFNFYSGDNSLRKETSKVLKQMLKSKEYNTIFGNVIGIKKNVKLTDNIDTMDLVGEGKVDFRILNGGSVGYPSHFSIIDDPYSKSSQASSRVQNENVMTNYRTGVISRRQNDTMIIITHSRWFEDDLIGYYRERQKNGSDKKVKIFNYPAIALENEKNRKEGEPLFSELRNIAFLNSQKKELKATEWSALYQQNPVPEAGDVFKIDWFMRYNNEPAREKCYLSIDTAFKAKKSNDPTAIGTWIQNNNNYYLVDVFCGRLEYPELKRKVKNLILVRNPDAVLIEDEASGQSLIQDLRKDSDIKVPIIAIKIPANFDKISRARTSTDLIEGGRVYLPIRASWLDRYECEVIGFPNAKHDDQVDMTTQYLNWVKTRIISNPSIRAL